MNIKKIIEESIQGYALPKKKGCSCGCNTCHIKKEKLNEAKDRVKHLVKETYKKLKEGEINNITNNITKDIPGFKSLLSHKIHKSADPEDGVMGWNFVDIIVDKDKFPKFIGVKTDLNTELNLDPNKYKIEYHGSNDEGHVIRIRYKGKESLKEETTSFLYKLEGVLVTSTHERNQTDILSDIRSISGVTIVSSKEYNADIATDSDNYKTYLTVKIDPHPFIGKGGFGKEQLKLIYNEIKRVIGVKAFQLKKKPVRIN
jgi:hypothetical protein